MKIGIDIGGSHIAVGLIKQDGEIILKKEKDFLKEDKKNIEEAIENIIKKYIKELLEETNLKIEDIELIGIAAPGTHQNQVIVKAQNLNLTNFKIVEILQGYYKNTVIKIANDAKCAAMCEKKYGNLKKYEDAIFICLGTGIGGAVFLDNKLLKPKRYSGFELRTYYN